MASSSEVEALDRIADEKRTENMLRLWEIHLSYGVFGSGLEETIKERLGVVVDDK